MAIPLARIVDLRASCPIHLQAAVLEVSPPTRWPGPATVRAKVQRVFRGDLSVQETIAIEMSAVDAQAGPPGEVFYGWTTLRAARYIEVYLIRTDKGVTLPTNSCSVLLDALTDAPVLAFPAPSDIPWTRRPLFQWLRERLTVTHRRP
jgi:hypothetical protein